MKLLDIVHLAIMALRDRKLRTILTILGVVIGPAVIVSLISATQGLSHSISSQISKMGVETLLITGGFGRTSVNIDDKMVREMLSIEGVRDIIPYYSIASGEVRIGGKSVTIEPASYTVIALDFYNLEKMFPGISLVEGTDTLSTNSGSSCIVGFSVANPTDPSMPSIKVGDSLVITTTRLSGGTQTSSSRSFLVKGTLTYYGQGFFLNPDVSIFVPVKVGELLTGRKSYSGLFIKAESVEMVEIIQNAIVERYGEGIRVVSISTITESVSSIMNSVSTFMGSIASMSLIVAFLGIMTTMFTSVTERVREIGLLKALGFKTKDVMLLFIMESMMIGLIGGLIGISVGSVGSYMVMYFFRGGLGMTGAPASTVGTRQYGMSAGLGQPQLSVSPIITPELIITTLLLAVLIGILAGLLPAWRAAKLTPIEALRYE
ncbi:MAG: ABC transporter permease [Nitrososphaerota archaeon]